VAGREPLWCESIHLGDDVETWTKKAKIKFLVLEEHKLGAAHTSSYVGNYIISYADLKASNFHNSNPSNSMPTHELLLVDTDGDPVLCDTPLVPCFIKCRLDEAGAYSLEAPVPRDSAPPTFPRHVFVMTRGTRGDVQPFIALARGLCNRYGWLVTICTEAGFKDFVLSKCADITDGEVRFRNAGGDTEGQLSSWVSQEIMSSKTEALQELMMAASESNFFASAPILIHHLRQYAAHGPPVDLIINAFTLTGVALLCGELCHIPVAGFCLQPTCIPSDDPNWHAIIPVDGGVLSLVEKMEENLFTSHAALKPVKKIFNELPFSALSLTSLRAQYNLARSSTWKAAFTWSLPIIIPMLPDAFARPKDWPDSFLSTDFIFLRSSAPGGGSLTKDLRDFIDAARAAGRKLMVMTFSSMPVARGKALEVAVEMLSRSRHDFSLLYVGKRQSDTPSAETSAAAVDLTAKGKLLEVERADFGLLFREMDAFIVHGGLGTTVEALRMRKPTVVTGILLMDQRFWGLVCYEKGVGPKPMHIEPFKEIAADWADRALDPESDYSRAAAQLEFGDEAEDGVGKNCEAFHELLESSSLVPPKGHLAEETGGKAKAAAVPKYA